MRNPIRLKNLNSRFVPFYLLGLALLAFFPPRPERFGIGLPFVALGLALRGWGAGHLVKNDALTTTGPYAHLRHPLYAGTLLVATGFAVLFGGGVGVALAAAIGPWFALHYFPRKERAESARLEARYGDAFKRYREAVPALWPRWARWRPASGDGQEAGLRGRWALSRYSDNNELGTLLAVVAGVALIWLRATWSPR